MSKMIDGEEWGTYSAFFPKRYLEEMREIKNTTGVSTRRQIQLALKDHIAKANESSCS